MHRDAADTYSLTLKMFSIGSRSLSHIDLITVARPFAKKLAEELGETVHMGILEDDSAVYVLKEESKYTIRMYSRVGKAIPLYCTAIGKIFLSEMDDDQLDSYLKDHSLKPFTPKSISDEQALREELKRIKDSGWSMDDEEHEMNIKCIAAPIRDYTGKTIAAISASWPVFRFEETSLEDKISEILAATRQISEIMGCSNKE